MFTGEVFHANRFSQNKQFALRTIFTFYLTCTICSYVAQALSCEAPCEKLQCETPTNCLGGTTQDPCGCCLTCARVANETCGGKFGLRGQCDQGLVCLLKVQFGRPITGDEEGMCKEPRETCSTLSSYSGCNKVDMQCVCSNISTCEDPLFEHNTRHECQDALARSLDEESEIGNESMNNARSNAASDAGDPSGLALMHVSSRLVPSTMEYYRLYLSLSHYDR